MSTDDDIFLKTFTKMIDLLTEIKTSLDNTKKTVDTLLPTIDGLGAALTKINSQLNDISSNLSGAKSAAPIVDTDLLHNDLLEIKAAITKLSSKQVSVETQKKVQKAAAKKTSSKKIKTTPKPKEKEQTVSTEAATSATAGSSLSNPEHPIFIDLHNRVNESTHFKEIGEILIESLEQIESSFSFSRVFYEIRRFGNSLIRKGMNDFPANDRMDLVEKLLEWEERLSD